LQLSTERPSNLPFHALAWSQEYIKRTNCAKFFTTIQECIQHSGPSPVHQGGYVNATYLREVNMTLSEPIKFVYYSESDHVLRIRDQLTMDVISAVSNSSGMFYARRRERLDKLDGPSEYMEGIHMGRSCGTVGYAIDWPFSAHVQPFVSQYS
jgi:hypothetical protein